MEEMMRTEGNSQKEFCEMFYAFIMEVAQMDPIDRKSSVLAMEVDLLIAIDPKLLKWADQQLDATFGTRTTRSPVTNRGSTSHIDLLFWEQLDKGDGKSHWGN